MVYLELLGSDRGLVLYVNAGHNNPILLHADEDATETLPATGHIVGPFPTEQYSYEFVLMRKGDILLLYTDGIVEALNERHEMYGEKRLIEHLRSLRARSPREICQAIVEDVQVHSSAGEYSDDKTLVAIKRTR